MKEKHRDCWSPCRIGQTMVTKNGSVGTVVTIKQLKPEKWSIGVNINGERKVQQYDSTQYY